jgi:hypothetical protein
VGVVGSVVGGPEGGVLRVRQSCIEGIRLVGCIPS